MIIDCLFCQKKLNWINRWAGATPEISWLQYRCIDCKVQYNFNRFIGQITDYKIKGDPYWLDVNLADGSCEILAYHDFNNQSEPAILIPVIKLLAIPANVTPQNINERLGTLVLFS